ncbi:MAG: hypothetical protein PF481_06420 [Bacteroidales bacterium]|jgi:hypothetical protein|nr:hypothetical protein [Bacteroidales bacterium]
MVQVFLIAVVFVGLAVIGLGINIFFRKKKFPDTEVGKNNDMRTLGLSCARCDEMKKFRQRKRFSKISLDIGKL